MKIAVLGHDANHEKWQRRMRAFAELGHDAHGLMFRRGPDRDRPWPHTDLGETFDGKLGQRAAAIGRGIRRAHGHQALRDADLIWARNLEMLVIAVVCRANSSVPIVYETLDIHEALYGNTRRAQILRAIEGGLLKRVSRILVSAPAFVTEYYDRFHPNHPPAIVLENKMPLASLPGRPTTETREAGTPIRVGWTGILRCPRTLRLLDDAARTGGGAIKVHLHGTPALPSGPNFEAIVAANPHMTYAGPYGGIVDLARVYADLDLVWAGDFSQSGGNSEWLLPNRLYEGGYFGVPALTPADTATAQWLDATGTGIVLNSPIEQSLQDFVRQPNLEDAVLEHRTRTRNAPVSHFAEGLEGFAQCINDALCR